MASELPSSVAVRASARSASARRVADLIRSGACKRIAFLTGAGVSVSAGIPDFRSPGGMYDTLKPELLTAAAEDRDAMRRDPTHVVSKAMFTRSAFPYLELRRPFILGIAERKWKATPCHWFMRLCYDQGLLVRVYTQNIDGLDFQLGLPHELLVPVHGSLGLIQCEACQADYPGGLDAFLPQVRANIKDIYGVDPTAPAASTSILCPFCRQPAVKPATVLYGGAMPFTFFERCSQDFPGDDGISAAGGLAPKGAEGSPASGGPVDLVFVMGTSLTVGPANLVPKFCRHGGRACVRVLINLDKVGDFQFGDPEDPATTDFFLQGSCDDGVKAIADALGWGAALLNAGTASRDALGAGTPRTTPSSLAPRMTIDATDL